MGTDQDFKYVIQDFSNVYVGARLTYEELTQSTDTPARLNSAIFMYIAKEAVMDKQICEHLYEIEEGSMPYMIYAQLKAQMKIVSPIMKTDKKGRQFTEYKTNTVFVTDFIKDKQLKECTDVSRVSEVTFKKLHLMSLSV